MALAEALRNNTATLDFASAVLIRDGVRCDTHLGFPGPIRAFEHVSEEAGTFTFDAIGKNWRFYHVKATVPLGHTHMHVIMYYVQQRPFVPVCDSGITEIKLLAGDGSMPMEDWLAALVKLNLKFARDLSGRVTAVVSRGDVSAEIAKKVAAVLGLEMAAEQ